MYVCMSCVGLGRFYVEVHYGIVLKTLLPLLLAGVKCDVTLPW